MKSQLTLLWVLLSIFGVLILFQLQSLHISNPHHHSSFHSAVHSSLGLHADHMSYFPGGKSGPPIQISHFRCRKAYSGSLHSVIFSERRCDSSLFEGCLIPAPAQIGGLSSTYFELNGNVQLRFASELSAHVSEIRNMLACEFGIIPQTKDTGEAEMFFALNPRLPKEGYTLTVSPSEIRITAREFVGIVYALQTLKQLLPPEVFNTTAVREFGSKSGGVSYRVPVVGIMDYPRYEWRGLHFDSARHFFPVEDIKNLLEVMALHKLNRFHWHLSDDQGWRLELKSHPELAILGGCRGPSLNPPVQSNGNRFLGLEYPIAKFYTQKEIREVVQLGHKLQIEIIPEVDVPAHTAAMIIAARQGANPVDLGYVDLRDGCVSDVHLTFSQQRCAPNCLGGSHGLLIPDNVTLTYLKEIFEELAQLFPSSYVHIGGDEATDLREKAYNSRRGTVLKQSLHLFSNEQLQAYLTTELMEYLTSVLRKQVIAWDETFVGLGSFRPSPGKGGIMMWWRDQHEEASWQRVSQLPYPMILTPNSQTYFDNFQVEPYSSSRFWVHRGTVSLKRAYDVGAWHAPNNILGVQGCLWTETLKSWSHVEYQLFPRLLALADAGWSSYEARNWTQFLHRVNFHKNRLDHLGIDYCRTTFGAVEDEN